MNLTPTPSKAKDDKTRVCVRGKPKMENLSWLDRQEYPFASNYLELEMGRMHYVDEGDGPPIAMVHVTPKWSFLYRRLVKDQGIE